MKSMDVFFDEAADLIEARGHWKGPSRPDRGDRRDAMGALYDVLLSSYGHGLEYGRACDDARREMEDHLRQIDPLGQFSIPDPTTGIDTPRPCQWNDDDTTDGPTVAKALRIVAAQIRSRPLKEKLQC